ncbi:Sugar transferase [Flavobacterium antarcticum]
MTFVGPRPDIPGYADELKGADRIILSVRPGLTGLASLKYRNEEYLLAKQSNPLAYNDSVIWPDKIRINKWYVQHRTWWMDVQILFYTVVPVGLDVERFMMEEVSH